MRERKFYEKTWFIVLCLIFCFPAGITLMWVTSNWKPVVKILVSVFFGIVLILEGIGIMCTDTSDVDTSSYSDYTVEETQPTESTDIEYDTTTKDMVESYVELLESQEGDGWEIYSWEYSDDNGLTLNYLIDGAVESATYLPDEWNRYMEEFSGTVSDIHETLGCDVTVNILNDQNTDNVLYTNWNGTEVYNVVD